VKYRTEISHHGRLAQSVTLGFDIRKGEAMGLFSRAPAPVVAPPQIQREDMAAAVAATPPKEMQTLRHDLPEIEFLANALPAGEEILSVAHADTVQVDNLNGVIAITKSRLVAAIGRRDKRGQPVGEPTVFIFPFQDLTEITFRADKWFCYGYFHLRNQDAVTLMIGRDLAWSEVFMNAAKQQFNRSRF